MAALDQSKRGWQCSIKANVDGSGVLDQSKCPRNINPARHLDLIEFVCWAGRIGLGGSTSGSAGCKASSMQANYGGAQWRLQVVALQFGS